MKTYTYPQMPVPANVWFDGQYLPPTLQGKPELVMISISPLSIVDFSKETRLVEGLYVSHIIRTAHDDRYEENWHQPNSNAPLFPCSIFEVPRDSGHWYLTLWYQRVGFGFPNHHARINVVRYSSNPSPVGAMYKGWI